MFVSGSDGSLESQRDPLTLLELARPSGSLNLERAVVLSARQGHPLEMGLEES